MPPTPSEHAVAEFGELVSAARAARDHYERLLLEPDVDPGELD